jgi:hydroxyacylglutathione hydrolase
VVFRQFVDEDLGCASYLIGDEEAGIGVVVDPGFWIEPYLEEARRHELRLTRVLETHTHADHVSGHGRLALEHGLPVSIHPLAAPEYPFDPLEDGTEIEVGRVLVTTLHTPGHRPEHVAFAVADRSRAPEPWLVLTGDSLFVADAGRPDLAVAALDGARELFASLGRLLELPDGVEVYPGHVAGSMCGTGMSSKASTTIGFERRFNQLLALTDVEDFVAASTRSAGLRPPNVERIVALNRGAFVGAPAELAPLRESGGAVVLDVRAAEDFAAGHVAGAINVPLESSAFGTKAGFVLDPDEPVVLHAGSPAEARLAARRLHAVGILDVAGYLDGPPTPARLEPIEIDELERLVAEDAVDVIDVREPNERDGGYIPRSKNVPYRLLRTLGDGIGGARPVVTICESGSRAGIAASILAASGVTARPVLSGGIPDWQARGNATVEFRRCGS